MTIPLNQGIAIPLKNERNNYFSRNIMSFPKNPIFYILFFFFVPANLKLGEKIEVILWVADHPGRTSGVVTHP
jgi:hypothetical protein